MSKWHVEDLDRNRAYAGRFLLRLGTLESTNSFCLENPSILGMPGLVVMADRQTKGRGSRGRNWESGTGRHLFSSFVIHPDVDNKFFPSMTILAGLAVFKALESIGVQGLSIKWPNDILIRNRKVSGILCESRLTPDVRAVVAGIGVNVSGSSAQFSPGIKHKAVTLFEHGIKISRIELVDRIAEELDHALLLAGKTGGGIEGLFRQWEKASSSIGKRVSFDPGTGEEHGIVMGLDAAGRLLIKKEDGRSITAASGTVDYC